MTKLAHTKLNDFTSEIPTILLPPYPLEPHHYENQTLIPVRKSYPSSVCSHWKNRTNRQIYLLSNGTYTEIDLARLLHKSLFSVRRSLGTLFCTGLITVRIKKEREIIPLDSKLLVASLDMLDTQERQQEFLTVFYGRLRTYSHAIDEFFSSAHINMATQGKKFFDNLKYITSGIYTNNPKLTKTIQELGIKNQALGIQSWMYPVIGEVLLETFEHYLGTNWTPKMKETWNAAYTLVYGVITSVITES